MEQEKLNNQAESVNKPQTRPNINDYFATLSQEEATRIRKENGSKGGKISGEKRRARKTFQEDLLAMLNQPIPPSIRKKEKIDGGTWQQAVLLGALKSASKGNTKGLEVISALIGEKPKEELVIETKEKDGFDQAIEQILNGNSELNEQEE